MSKQRQSEFGVQPISLSKARPGNLPKQVDPALAEAVQHPPVGDKWLHEIKLDGYRMLCRKDGDQVRFLSRRQQDWTDRFERLVSEAQKIPARTAILDGEVVVVSPEGLSSFQALQTALSDSRSDRMLYYVFDLLFFEGLDLSRVKLQARKDLLQQVLEHLDSPRIVYWDHVVGNGAEVFEQARGMEVEGIVSKRRDHPYRSGRTSSWQKAKFLESDEFLIGAFTDPSKKDHGFGALLLGQFNQQGDLIYAGRVGTGFGEEVRRLLLGELVAHEVAESPFKALPVSEGGKGVHFVEPALVAHVEYLERTNEKGVLRHAVFKGLREDIATNEVTSAEETNSPKRRQPLSLPKSINELPDIRFTHPDKIVYPSLQLTKLDLAKYYAQVGESMLPHLEGRPLSLVRCPDSIDGPSFFQKRPPAGVPEFIQQIEVPSGESEFKPGMMVDDLSGLLSLVQIYAVEIHTWGARSDRLDRPDRIVFDLDPHASVPWQRVKQAAVDLRQFLRSQGLESFVLATGGKGLHLAVPIARRYGWDRVKEFSQDVAHQFTADRPGEFTTTSSLSAREGKIFIDYLRNRQAATFIAPYSTRASSGATVAMPLAWKELNNLRSPQAFDIYSAAERVQEQVACPWQRVGTIRQRLPKL